MKKYTHLRVLVIVMVGLFGIIGCETEEPERKDFYYIVTHGPTTDEGFWGDLLNAAKDVADSEDVMLIPLHPLIETSGDLLNVKLQEAIDAKPNGIVGTIWGEGMVEVVRNANASEIPIVAINVYPDSNVFVGNSIVSVDEKPGILCYVGMDDHEAGEAMIMALLQYAYDGYEWDGNTSNPPSCSSDWNACVEALGVYEIAVFNHQSSAGLKTRADAIAAFLSSHNEGNRYRYIDGTVTTIAEQTEILREYVNSLNNHDKILLVFLGESGVSSYQAFLDGLSVAEKLVLSSQILAAATFDTGEIINSLVESGELAFCLDQRQSLQGSEALRILISYNKNKQLPTLEEMDENWFLHEKPFPVYKSGPYIKYTGDS